MRPLPTNKVSLPPKFYFSVSVFIKPLKHCSKTTHAFELLAILVTTTITSVKGVWFPIKGSFLPL